MTFIIYIYIYIYIYIHIYYIWMDYGYVAVQCLAIYKTRQLHSRNDVMDLSRKKKICIYIYIYIYINDKSHIRPHGRAVDDYYEYPRVNDSKISRVGHRSVYAYSWNYKISTDNLYACLVNTTPPSTPGQNGGQITDDKFKYNFVNSSKLFNWSLILVVRLMRSRHWCR